MPFILCALAVHLDGFSDENTYATKFSNKRCAMLLDYYIKKSCQDSSGKQLACIELCLALIPMMVQLMSTISSDYQKSRAKTCMPLNFQSKDYQ